MKIRDLIKKLLEMDLDQQIYIDAAGRGTYLISDVEGSRRTGAILITESIVYERSSVHDTEDTIEHFTSSRG